MEEHVREIKNWLQLSFISDRVNAQLRKLLLSKLEKICGSEWDSTAESISLLEKAIGRKSLKFAGAAARERIANGDVCSWDLTAVSFVLRSLSGELVSCDEKQQMDAAVGVRNYLAHHPNRIVPEEEFAEKWNVLLGVLKFFDAPIDLIEKEIRARTTDIASLYSPTVLNQEANKLKEEGNKAFRGSHYDKAVEKYGEAMGIITLKDAERGILFANRSAAFLQLAKAAQEDEERKSYARRAQNDAKRATHLQPLWPKGHLRLGDAYQVLEKYDKAIGAYDEALALDPNCKVIKTRCDDCRLILSQRKRADHLDSMNMVPSSVEEMVQQMNQYQRNKIVTAKGIKSMTGTLREMGDELGVADVHEAINHRDGLGTPVNYKLAAKYFSKAAAKGNAQATYELAVLTQNGTGVQKNHQLALQLFHKAAKMAPDLATGLSNIGVREAMHSVGLLYQEGVCVDKNAMKAFEWYKRAADLGYGPSANNLAIMYSRGEGGIPCVDCEKAVQYWKLAAQDKNTRAMESLAYYYCEQGDLKQARNWMKWAVEGGNVEAMAQERLFETMCRQKEEKMSSLKHFLESELGQPLREDEPIQDIHKAYLEQHYPELLEAMNNLDLIDRRAAACSPHNIVDVGKYDPRVIAEYAAQGRVYAQQLMKALQHYYTAMLYLISSGNNHNEIESDNLIGELAQCLEIAPFVALLRPKDKSLVLELTKRKMSTFKDTTCQLDIYARECYAFIIMASYQENVAFLKICIAKYPKVCYFYNGLTSMYGFLKQYTEGLIVAEKALLLFPNNLELLYDKAVLAKLAFNETKRKPDQEIENYLKFIQNAPADHRKVPEAFYSIASLVVLKRSISGDADTEEMELYYKKGLESEVHLLPCFLPYESNSRDILSSFLEFLRTAAQRKRPLKQRAPQRDAVLSVINKPKSRLTNPVRVIAILGHRTMLNEISTIGAFTVRTTVQPRFEQVAPPTLAGLKAVTFSEMNPMEDKVYENCILDVILIEDPDVNMPSVHVLLEDQKGEVLRGFFYNVKGDPRVKYGAIISIVNPYLRIGAQDGKPGIRVDDPKSLFFHSEDGSDRCRYCGEKNSKFQCIKCTRKYCSKECQTQDWKVLKHKLICTLKIVEIPNIGTFVL